jgi:hypothetical protein
MTLSPYDYGFWVLGFLLEVYVVVCTIVRKSFLRYLPLNLYMLGTATSESLEYLLTHKYGLTSPQYMYFYYYSESLLCVFLYFVIMGFYKEVFKEMNVSKHVRTATLVVLAGTMFFSYLVVRNNQSHLTSRFVVALGQNLYFVGVALTYLLWIALLKLRETRARLVQLVLALGVYFSALAAIYALRNLFPTLETPILKFLIPLVGAWLPLAWGYTFTKVPEDARLEPSRLTVGAAAP